MPDPRPFLERRLQRHGVEVDSIAEENGDGPVAEFIRGQLALVAQLERAMIPERVTAGKAMKKALGRHVYGRVPFGFQSEGGILTPIPELVPVVRRIFGFAKDGQSPGRIARDLNRDGVQSPQGASWSAKVVHRVVTNPVHAGERYNVKSAQPAVVSRRLFNLANDALASRTATWARRSGRALGGTPTGLVALLSVPSLLPARLDDSIIGSSRSQLTETNVGSRSPYSFRGS